MAKFSEYLKNLRQSGRLSFTINQASSDLGISRHNVLASIFRIKKSGEIISPAKGFYVIIPPEHQLQGCLPASQLVPILMQHLKINYYVGLLSCAMYHGATHQKPNSFQIISDKQIRKNLKFKYNNFISSCYVTVTHTLHNTTHTLASYPRHWRLSTSDTTL